MGGGLDMERGNSKGGERATGIIEEPATVVDWKGRPSDPSKHGGMRAAVFVLGMHSFILFSLLSLPR